MIIVTGGAGFIGSWVAEKLINLGYDVVIIDDLSTGSLDNISNIMDNVKFIKIDIVERDKIIGLVRRLKPTAVIHLAAMTNVVEAEERPARCFDVNVVGTINILESSRIADVDRVVYASSAAIYGDQKKLPISEEAIARPKNMYGLTKYLGEVMVHTYNELYGIRTISLRYFNVYGPRMRPGRYAGVIYKFIEHALTNAPLTIYGDGMQTRDFIYITDVVEATIKAMGSKAIGAYNIGTGKPTRIIDLAKMIIELTGSRSKIVFAPPRKGDVRYSVADISKAIKKLGWRPKTTLKEGLLKTIDYVKTRLMM